MISKQTLGAIAKEFSRGRNCLAESTRLYGAFRRGCHTYFWLPLTIFEREVFGVVSLKFFLERLLLSRSFLCDIIFLRKSHISQTKQQK